MNVKKRTFNGSVLEREEAVHIPVEFPPLPPQSRAACGPIPSPIWAMERHRMEILDALEIPGITTRPRPPFMLLEDVSNTYRARELPGIPADILLKRYGWEPALKYNGRPRMAIYKQENGAFLVMNNGGNYYRARGGAIEPFSALEVILVLKWILENQAMIYEEETEE